MPTSYQIRYSHTSARETFPSYEAAEAAIRAVYSDPVIEEQDGSALVWTSEELATNDDGRRACARIVCLESDEDQS